MNILHLIKCQEDVLFRKYLAELIHTDLYRLNHKLRTVIALQTEGVMLWILLWQEESLPYFSIFEIGKIDAAIVIIIPTACQHNPMSIA